MTSNIQTVHARLDDTHDGAWADCPHCGWHNGVSWAKKKECTGCGKHFTVASGPLVQEPQAHSCVLIGPGGTLFYSDPNISYP